MSEARIHPPSEQRLTEARRAGHVPRAPLLLLCAIWGSFAIGLWLIAERVTHGMSELFRGPLATLARGQRIDAGEWLSRAFSDVFAPFFIVLSACWAVVCLVTLLAQGPAFGFSAASRVRLPPLRIPRTGRVLFVLGSVAISGFTLRAALHAKPEDAGQVLMDFALHVGVWLLGCGLIELGLSRAEHWRSLWLTRSEHKTELREAYGSPEVRALRDRVRRESAHEAPP